MKPASSIDQQIVQAYADVVRKEKIVIHLEHLKAQIEENQIRLAILKETMEREEADYLRLEKVGIHRFFSSSTDEKNHRLDREKQEFLLAYLKYQECEKNLQLGLQEQKVLMDTLYGLFEVEKILDQLLIEKRKQLSKPADSYQLNVAKIEESIIRSRLQLQEIREAQVVGEKLLPRLKKMTEELKTVKKTGALDYAGRGRYSSYKKKKFIEKAAQEILQISTQLRNLEQELHDISTHYNLQYEEELALFKHFIDDFLQKLISDWRIRKQVVLSLQAIEAISEEIKAIIKNLDLELEKARFLIRKDQERVKAVLLKMAQKKESPN